MYKYVVGKRQKHLIVSEQVHQLVKEYAHEKNLTMVEATYELLRTALTKVYKLEQDAQLEENSQHNQQLTTPIVKRTPDSQLWLHYFITIYTVLQDGCTESGRLHSWNVNNI